MEKERMKYLKEKYGIEMRESRLYEICDWFDEDFLNEKRYIKPPKSELRHSDTIKFKQNPKDIPSDYLDFRSEKAMENASESLKYLFTKKK